MMKFSDFFESLNRENRYGRDRHEAAVPVTMKRMDKIRKKSSDNAELKLKFIRMPVLIQLQRPTHRSASKHKLPSSDYYLSEDSTVDGIALASQLTPKRRKGEKRTSSGHRVGIWSSNDKCNDSNSNNESNDDSSNDDSDNDNDSRWGYNTGCTGICSISYTKDRSGGKKCKSKTIDEPGSSGSSRIGKSSRRSESSSWVPQFVMRKSKSSKNRIRSSSNSSNDSDNDWGNENIRASKGKNSRSCGSTWVRQFGTEQSKFSRDSRMNGSSTSNRSRNSSENSSNDSNDENSDSESNWGNNARPSWSNNGRMGHAKIGSGSKKCKIRIVDEGCSSKKRNKGKISTSSGNRSNAPELETAVRLWSRNSGITSSSSSNDSDSDSDNNTGYTSIGGIGYAKCGSGRQTYNSKAIDSSSSKGIKRKGQSSESSSRVPQVGTSEHAVSRLEELRPQTRYDVLRIEGPPHSPIFVVSVIVDGKVYKGRGASKQHAKTSAAERALTSLLRRPANDQLPSTAQRSSHTEQRPTPGRNPVTVLNELRGVAVTYDLIDEEGEAHAKTFTMSVRVGERMFRGAGSSKKMAKYNAAQAAVGALYSL